LEKTRKPSLARLLPIKILSPGLWFLTWNTVVPQGSAVADGGKDSRAAVEETAMEDPSLEVAARKSRSHLPETQEEAAELAALIELAIEQETGRGVHGLSVTIESEGIVLAGHCESFYHKQLAQHAAMSISGGQQLVNSIEVR
jgi:hypothetical protein